MSDSREVDDPARRLFLGRAALLGSALSVGLITSLPGKEKTQNSRGHVRF